jgi:protein gp37
MGTKSSIEWTEATWNPLDTIKVCSVASPKDNSVTEGGAYAKLRRGHSACWELTLDDRAHGSRISSLAVPF